MGIMATVLQYVPRSRGTVFWPSLKVEDRKGENKNVNFFQGSGEDSPPLPTDNVALVDEQRQGGKMAVGVIDPKNAGVAVPGEWRRYARDSSGNIVSDIHLKGDGSFVLKNVAGKYNISIDNNGIATFTCESLDIISTDLTHNGINIGDTHVHSQGSDSNGDAEVDTDGPK